MRTIIKKNIIPEEIIEQREEEITTYGCDSCNFESYDDEEVTQHYAITHACREEKTIGRERFVRFETEEDMELWAEAQCVNSFNGGYFDDFKIKWYKPGWYHICGESERCGRGCCTNYILHFESISDFVYALEGEIIRKQNKLDEIAKEFSLDKE